MTNFFSKNKAWIITLGIILILVLYFVGRYNAFVSLDQDVNGKWSEVENQYQRQFDLIPNLVSVVQSSIKIETNFIKDVTEARSRWQTSRSLSGPSLEKDTAGAQMTNAITAFVNAVAIAENYPLLQANKQYVALTDELSGTQNRITVSRGRYIESIQKYNTAIKEFPGNLLANLYGFTVKDYYKAELSALKTPSLGTGQLP